MGISFTIATDSPGGALNEFNGRSHPCCSLSHTLSPRPPAPSALFWYWQKEARHRARPQLGQTRAPCVEKCGIGRSGGQYGEAQVTFDQGTRKRGAASRCPWRCRCIAICVFNNNSYFDGPYQNSSTPCRPWAVDVGHITRAAECESMFSQLPWAFNRATLLGNAPPAREHAGKYSWAKASPRRWSKAPAEQMVLLPPGAGLRRQLRKWSYS